MQHRYKIVSTCKSKISFFLLASSALFQEFKESLVTYPHSTHVFDLVQAYEQVIISHVLLSLKLVVGVMNGTLKQSLTKKIAYSWNLGFHMLSLRVLIFIFQILSVSSYIISLKVSDFELQPHSHFVHNNYTVCNSAWNFEILKSHIWNFENI